MSSPIVLKLKYNGETRRLRMESASLTLSELHDLIGKLWELKQPAQVTVLETELDGETRVIKEDRTLQKAVSNAVNLNAGKLRIKVTKLSPSLSSIRGEKLSQSVNIAPSAGSRIARLLQSNQSNLDQSLHSSFNSSSSASASHIPSLASSHSQSPASSAASAAASPHSTVNYFALEARLENLSAAFNNHLESVRASQAQSLAQSSFMNPSELDAQEKRFHTVFTRLGHLDARFAALQERFDAQQDRQTSEMARFNSELQWIKEQQEKLQLNVQEIQSLQHRANGNQSFSVNQQQLITETLGRYDQLRELVMAQRDEIRELRSQLQSQQQSQSQCQCKCAHSEIEEKGRSSPVSAATGPAASLTLSRSSSRVSAAEPVELKKANSLPAPFDDAELIKLTQSTLNIGNLSVNPNAASSLSSSSVGLGSASHLPDSVPSLLSQYSNESQDGEPILPSRYEQELSILHACGYTIRAFNLALLELHNGNLPQVLKDLSQFSGIKQHQ